MNTSSAVAFFIAAKEKARFSPGYISGLRLYVGKFATEFNGRPVSEITSHDVEHWFETRREKPVTAASNLGRLSSFFSWAKRRRLVNENPCAFIERFRVERDTPMILEPEQLETLLLTALDRCPQWILWLVLGAIVGMRPGEIMQMSRAEIAATMAQSIIIVHAAKTKTRRRRVIQLNAQAKAWVELGLKIGGRDTLGKMTMRRRTRQMRDWLGLSEWKQDLLRHTALSYQLAETQDAAKVALAAGNSPKILLTHYNGLVTPNQLEKWRSIRP